MTVTKEEVLALLAENNKTLTDTINTSVNTSLSGLAARIQKETDKKFEGLTPPKEEKPAPAPESTLEFKALQQQLADLKTERDQDKQTALDAQRSNVILNELNGRKLAAPGTLKKFLASEYADSLVKEGDSWYVKQGEKVTSFNAVVDDFLKSPDGLVFSPPASSVNGNDSKSGNTSATPPDQDSKPTLDSMLQGIKSGTAELKI